ncbi:TetR/AcrR family transcriptional regulator [Actinoplanes friuliensis]|uniref:TetR family transcriptional regulator n=1 Tax=Actinoplanes friuliensis DSM 7358 TaxID=1246995 RepID=U5VZ29_9ACTN|nr:TetR/AcrR family transcriptional regulator [Actinoplanes friuliensis]AGZ40931.1 TetR family transcriptional regulator [Actinoplanes friuliensis DSM 7358]
MTQSTPFRRRRGAALEQALLDAAWAEISERGYEALNFDDVAARAGTSKPVVYRRWPSKAELARAAFRHAIGRDPLAVPDTGNLRDDVITLLRQVNEHRVGIATALIAQLGDLYRATGTSMEDLRASLAIGQETAMEQIVGRAVQRGEVDPAQLTDRIVQLPVDLFRHQLLMTARAVPDADIIEIVDTIFTPAVTRSTGAGFNKRNGPGTR